MQADQITQHPPKDGAHQRTGHIKKIVDSCQLALVDLQLTELRCTSERNQGRTIGEQQGAQRQPDKIDTGAK